MSQSAANNSEAPRKRLRPQHIVLMVVLAWIPIAGPSVLKYFLYERPNAAPRLRAAIGKQVIIPWSVARGAATTSPCILKSVKYRLNDKWGWFDLDVITEHLYTGLSPTEAAGVVISEPSRSFGEGRITP